MTEHSKTVTFTPGALLIPCPFCGWVLDGITEGELWRHLVSKHDALNRSQNAAREIEDIKTWPELRLSKS